MDILTHTLSGIAVGTVAISFLKQSMKEKLLIVAVCGFAGALPDIDAISLWSGFDSTFGKLFNLSHTGREIYSAKFWYSHHAFMHSLLAGVLFAGVIGAIKYLFEVRFKKLTINGLLSSIHKNKLLLIAFVAAFTIHLMEDMVTPASTWGGVNFFFPSKSYIGGTGDIWWWNNYDVFLIVVGVILVNLILLGAKRFVKFDVRKFTVGVIIIAFVFALVQIKTRDFDFAYSGYSNKYNEFEAQSKQQQKDILGEKLFQVMERFDNKLKIYF